VTKPGQGDNPGGERPEYKVYKSGRGPSLSGFGGLGTLRKKLDRQRPDPPDPSKRRKPISVGRVFKWLALAVFGWVLLSAVLFIISAQIQDGVSDETHQALSANGNMFSGSTVLVLGSDQRTGDSIDASDKGPARADSILLVHARVGKVTKLSIPRDSEAAIPGHGTQKINAAYALGGAPLMIDTVEQFLGNGLEIEHLVEVDFEGFPAFIDSLGGVTVRNKTCIRAPPFDNYYKGYRLSKGEHEINGRQALGFARVRTNNCATNENDLDRARRQQQVLGGVRDKLLSPGTFVRLPWVSWRAPQALNTDMRSPSMFGLAADFATGGSGKTRVLRPRTLTNPLTYTEEEKAGAVRELVGENS